MACGGFTCTRSILALLNVFYIAVSFILIGVAAYGKAVAVIATIQVMGGIIACGVFLLLVAIIGLIGAIKHHQVLLFFYMIILFLVFLVQFAVACACLALSDSQQKELYTVGWNRSSFELKQKTQKLFNCCGFDETTQHLVLQPDSKGPELGHPSCSDLTCCNNNPHNVSDPCCSPSGFGHVTTPANDSVVKPPTCTCKSCWTEIEPELHQAVKFVGGLGLFFSFTELMAVWYTVRYRNTKDPKINPATFI